MNATLQGLCHNTTRTVSHGAVKSIPIRCQFPVRARFLKSHLPKLHWPDEDKPCPELDDWRRRTYPQKISLVFSSYYANNPSSVFGHTLLRADPHPVLPHLPISPLLSTGINFAAEVDKVNALNYAIGGMMGHFPGKFTALPYYYKVREYADFDSRDLWEYELKLTSDQRSLLIDHLWELGFTHFDYFYFTENCSYQLVTALEAVIPNLRASKKLPYWVIPADTVKAIVREPELLGTINFRPSLHRQFSARLARLDFSEQKILTDIVFKKDFVNLEQVTPLRQAVLLDAALDFWDFKHNKELARKEQTVTLFKQDLLKRRAQAPITEPLSFKPEDFDRPDLSHESMRYGLLFEQSERRSLLNLDFRFALHDLLDAQKGYPQTAKIEFFRFNLKIADAAQDTWRGHLSLNKATFFDVQLLSPMDRFNRHFSWRGTIGADRRIGLGCDDCLMPMAAFEGGTTYGLINNKVLFFALAGAEVRPQAMIPEVVIGNRIQYSDICNSLIEHQREFPIGRNFSNLWETTAELRCSPNLNFSIGSGLRIKPENESSAFVSLYYYC